tara:strand:- start:1864 stop:3003 length:1140 start_codon:yes stop_codon:yes gene_type:complete
MIISETDALWAADQFISYFKRFETIEDYIRVTKEAAVNERGKSIISLKDEFFNEDVHPEEMEFEIKSVGDRFGYDPTRQVSQDTYHELLTATSSAIIEKNIPGRELRWIVYEKKSGTILGFIRFGSPTINSKPRNEWLGQPANLSIFNQHSVMGFAIVPSQPFGYNYLGGKLLALMCVSHFARETLNEVFEKDIAWFETTSLYGSTTSSSQYDGLKPFIRYKGLTDSKFLPLLHDKAFHELHNRFTKINNNNPVTPSYVSSKKMKRQTRMISWTKNSLKEYGKTEKLKELDVVLKNAFGLTQRKRSYTSDYGYGNVREVLLGEQDKLVRGQNWDKFYLENIVKWWKKKAGKRYEKLKSEGRFRNEVELWTEDDNIQIIR